MWRLDITERVHQMREACAARCALPDWVLSVRTEPEPIDWALLRLRARMAFSHPGVEVR